MKLCDNNHDEICFDDNYYGKNCPLCKEMNDHEENTNKLLDKIVKLEETITELEDKVMDLEAGR